MRGEKVEQKSGRKKKREGSRWNWKGVEGMGVMEG